METYNYEYPDEYFVLNDRDVSLTPIYISLPKPPPIEMIDGYGKPPEEQVFKKLRYPPKLKALEDDVMAHLKKKSQQRDYKINGYTIYKEFWSRIDAEVNNYKNEIDWIKRVWWHRLNGYWFFNNGKPTYISGWHFTYLNFYFLGEAGQYPDYRDRDRRWFLAQKYCYECTETFADLDREGKAVKVDGKYRMKDLGTRLFYGTVNSKGRRIGDTSKAGVPYLEIGATTFGGICGIISFGGESAEAAFKKKFIPAWQRMPIWMKPMYANSNDPNSIKYNPPANVYGEEGLNTLLDTAGSGDEKSYDSKKVSFLLCDEEGKLSRHDVNARWETLKLCLSEGDDITGYSIHPTTVEEMEEGGGKEFFDMMKNANFYVRMADTGMTKNGLMRLFFRASDGRKGAIDKYGMSVEFEPTEQQKRDGFSEGAFTRIEKQREQLIKSGKPEDLHLYRQMQRKFPIYYMDSFVDEAGGLGFDYVKIGEALDRLKNNPTAKRYNIMKVSQDGDRKLVPHEEGKFLVSIDLPAHRTNQKMRVLEYDPVLREQVYIWRPRDLRTFVAGADPITYFKKREEKRGTRISKAGGCVFWNYDPQLDKSENPKDWESFRTIVTYLYQPTTADEYAEDMLDMCVYFSCPMYTENNKTLIWEHFVKRGYDGYLLYDLDDRGIRKQRPGVWLNDQTKQKGFSKISDYITLRLDKEQHIDLVEQMDSIKAFDELNKHDLLSAFMCALLGADSQYGELVQRFENQNVDVSNMFDFL